MTNLETRGQNPELKNNLGAMQEVLAAAWVDLWETLADVNLVDSPDNATNWEELYVRVLHNGWAGTFLDYGLLDGQAKIEPEYVIQALEQMRREIKQSWPMSYKAFMRKYFQVNSQNLEDKNKGPSCELWPCMELTHRAYVLAMQDIGKNPFLREDFPEDFQED